MTRPATTEIPAMLFAECPLCDRPTPLDAETGALDCAACAMNFELAEESAQPELAAAA